MPYIETSAKSGKKSINLKILPFNMKNHNRRKIIHFKYNFTISFFFMFSDFFIISLNVNRN